MTDWLERMPPFLGERVHAEGWKAWRPVQEESFRVLFDTDDHLLISAGTSSGKTEAAMIPVISSLYENPTEGFGAIYVGPTKALIDDQFARMDRMLRDSRLAVAGWHGDVPSSSKESLRRAPGGILQITPESLQGVVTDGPGLLRRMFPDLRFVVVDEVHSFMASDRGLQLLCELAAIERAAGCSPRRIGLSATVSDPEGAAAWLKAESPRGVSTVRQGEDSSGRIGVKHFRIPAGDGRGEAVLAYYRELFRLTDPYSCIVFANSRVSAERTARSLAKVSEAERSPNPVRIHHGSLSAALRRSAEADLKGGGATTVVATSTLELGMDVGGLDRVVQVGAPYTCSSMLQRMGRTGRRGGRREMVVVAVDDDSKWSPSPPGVSLELVRAVAVADLGARGGWTEPLSPNPLPFGLLYHQMLAYLKGADHDVRWGELRDSMLSMWAFRNVSGDEAAELARHMLHERHLLRMEDGTLLIGPEGERVAFGRGFASVFEAPQETEVQFKGEVVGSVQGDPKEGAVFSLAGRLWRVAGRGRGWVDVREAEEGEGDAKWESAPPEVDDTVAARMREILDGYEEFPFLDSAAGRELDSSRLAFHLGGYDGFVETADGFVIYPWAGTRRFEGIRRVLAAMDGVEVRMCASPVWILVRTGMSERQVRRRFASLAGSADPEDFVLPEDVEDMGKYEGFVPEGLRAREFAARRLALGPLRPNALSTGPMNRKSTVGDRHDPQRHPQSPASSAVNH